MNEAGIAYVPPASARGGQWLARAFDGVTPRMFGFVVVATIAYQMPSIVEQGLTAIADGQWRELFPALWMPVLSSALPATIMFCVIVASLNLAPRQGWRQIAVPTAAILSGTLVAVAIWLPLIRWLYADEPDTTSITYLIALRHQGISYGLLSAMLYVVALTYRRTQAALDATHRADVERDIYERRMTEAHLQVLQAQIEPHFLFNTLANVRRLYEADCEAGHRMLDHLMRYFEVALPQMRAGSATLEREAALVESYLNVQKIRLGRRLQFSIEMPEATRTLDVPPMMLLTLVENAIKHGIAPLPEGGAIRVIGDVHGNRLVMSVIDTGRGLTGTTGAGTGLSNIGARLYAAYGREAGLSIEGNLPRGIVAKITLPISRAASQHARESR